MEKFKVAIKNPRPGIFTRDKAYEVYHIGTIGIVISPVEGKVEGFFLLINDKNEFQWVNTNHCLFKGTI